MMFGRNKRETFRSLCERMRFKVQSWGARLLSQGGQEVFIRVVLQALPTYSMSCFFLFPKVLCLELESIMCLFQWQKSSTRWGIRWCKWSDLCTPKNLGGLGFRDLCIFTVALLVKQGWRLLTNPASLLARIYSVKYFPNTSFWNARLGSYPSFTWKSIFAARKLLVDEIGWSASSAV